MTKDELEAAIAVANIWSGRSTLVLAIGILGEYALLPFLEKKRWQKGAKIFCAVLVVAGIFGEYEFSSQISQNAGELQRLSDTEVADAQAVASKADDHAKSAEASGKQLGINLESEKQKTAKFQKEASDAQLALTKRLEYVSRHQYPRSLNVEKFLRTLARGPIGKAMIWYRTSDPETFVLSSQIFDALGKGTGGKPGAGWEVYSPTPIPESMPASYGLCFGVCVIAKTIAEPPGPFLGTPLEALSVALGSSIEGNSHSVTSWELPSLPAGTFIILVGRQI